MKIPSINAINWPEGYIPDISDNFASNEMIVAGLRVADFRPYAVRGGKRVSGQNPAAASEVARLTLEALREGAK